MAFLDFFKRMLPQAKSAPANHADPRTASDRMLTDLALAEAIYTNTPPWLNEESPPLVGGGIGAMTAAEVARLITVEAKITVENAENVNAVIQDYVMPNLRYEVEKGWALGGLIFKPYYNNAVFEFDKNNGNLINVSGKLRIAFIYTSQFLIDEYDVSGLILRVRFFSIATKDNRFYTKVEEQSFDEASGTLTITNTVYETGTAPSKYKWDDLGSKVVPLETVERWKNILPKLIIPKVKGCLIGFYRPAIAYNTNVNSPYGLSPLVRAANAIRRADRTLNGLDWEMGASLARLYIDEMAVAREDDAVKKFAKYVIKLNPANDNARTFEKFSPDMRDVNYLNIYNAHLRHIEDILGLAHGTISDAQEITRTATEISKSRQRTYAMVVDNQKSLEMALRQLVYAIQVWMNPLQVADELKQTYDFDDSIVNNPDEQLAQYMILQNAGNIPAWKTNMMYFNCSEEAAKQMAVEGMAGTFDEMTKEPVEE